MLNCSKALSILAILIAIAPLTSCANSSGGNALENLLAPDPQLQTTPTPKPSAQLTPTPTPSTPSEISLPDNFPANIPQYPNGTLEVVAPLTPPEEGLITRWFSADSATLIKRYYKTQLAEKNWEISTSEDGSENQIDARLDSLQLTLSFTPPSSGETVYTLTYRLQESARSPSQPQPSPKPSPAVKPSPLSSNIPASEIPASLQTAVEQVLALDIINSDNSKTFQPNQIITRREYARWLIEVNNKLYEDDAGKQIRLASSSEDPIFQDVPKTDPDFPYIQGLAETGLIPSALTGEATTTRFRPDAPLTRQAMISWKVPLDSRAALPKATLDAVKETWGFQDASKINAQALPSVLADFQNGNNANIRRVFGYTRLFQPQKSVTRAEAAAVLAYFGTQGEVRSAQEANRANQPTID